MSQRRSSRLQQPESEGSSPSKNNGKNSNKSTPKQKKNNQMEKETQISKATKSAADEKNPPAKISRRKSDQKTNTTNISADKATSDETPKRGQKRKASSDENEGPKNKKQKTADLSNDNDNDVPFEESSSSQRRRSGKSADEKVDEILDIRAEQWHQIDQFALEGSDNTGGDEKMAVYNSLTDADVASPAGQRKLARTTVVNSKGKKVRFNAYSDLLSGDKDDLSFLTADDKSEYDEKEAKKEQYFRALKARLSLMTEEEQKAEVRRLYYEALQRKAKQRGSNYPMQSTPVGPKVNKAPKTAPNIMRTNALRNPSSPTKFNATKVKTTADENRNNTNKKSNARADLIGEENGSPSKRTPKKTKSTTVTPKKGSETPKSAVKATPSKSKSKSTPANTPSKTATKAMTNATAKNTPSKNSTSTPNKTKTSPSKSNSTTPSKVATSSKKKASPKKSLAKPIRARARPTRFSL